MTDNSQLSKTVHLSTLCCIAGHDWSMIAVDQIRRQGIPCDIWKKLTDARFQAYAAV
jgi:hypothetical protein